MKTFLNNAHLIIKVILGVALTALIYSYQYNPPEPKPADVSEVEFSAARALETLEILVGDNIPHPSGSKQNEIVRNRIIQLLADYGYDVSTQYATMIASFTQDPISITNVMSRLKGDEGGPAIMLAAHFDSVNEGPGASDDGVGVAVILEISRMLKSLDRPRNDVIFLLTDGEEMGLLGARAFVKEHDWAEDVGVVINLEARGISGPSIMFETSEDNLWLVDVFSSQVDKPFASSLFFEVYRRLPNNTDFSVFKHANMEGYNFSYIGDVRQQHTKDDNIQNLEIGSLQHHGDNMFSLVQVLKNTDFQIRKSGKAVYFDFFGWKVIWWPAEWSVYVSFILMSVLSLSYFFSIVNSGNLKSLPLECWKTLMYILVVGALTLFTCVALWFMDYLLKIVDMYPYYWTDTPLSYLFSYWLFGVAIIAFFISKLADRFDEQRVWVALWLIWATLSVVTSYYINGISYLFIVPSTISVAIYAFIVLTRSKYSAYANLISLVSVMGVVILWLPLEYLFYDAVGFSMNEALILRVGIVLSAVSPIFVSAGGKTSRAVSGLFVSLFGVTVMWSIVV